MAPRLKVFAVRLGFFDTVVAASSRKAALAAWGVHQDLFKDGSARETDEPEARAALDRPGVVLRRTVGSTGAYGEDAAAAVPSGLRPPRSKPKPKPAPDRGPLNRAEAALAAAEAAHQAETAELTERVEALQAELHELEATWTERAAGLEAEVAAARAAYGKAGGRV